METETLEDTVRSRFSTDTDRNEIMYLLKSSQHGDTQDHDIVRVAQIYRETHLLRLKKLEIFILTKNSIQYFEVIARHKSGLFGNSPLTPNGSHSNLYDEVHNEDQLKHIDLKDSKVHHFTEIPLTDVLEIQADQHNAKLIHHILHYPFTIYYLNKKNNKQREVIYCPSWDECQRWVEVITKTKSDFEKNIEDRTKAMLAATE